MASQITSLTIVYSTVYSGADQRKHQSSASLSFVRGIHRWPVNSPHKGPVTWKMFPFNDVIMEVYKMVIQSPDQILDWRVKLNLFVVVAVTFILKKSSQHIQPCTTGSMSEGSPGHGVLVKVKDPSALVTPLLHNHTERQQCGNSYYTKPEQ